KPKAKTPGAPFVRSPNRTCNLISFLPAAPRRRILRATMIVPTADLYKIAYAKYAVGAYNINNLEQTMGLFRGCIQSQAPFIIQLSKGARKYADKRMLEAIIRTAEEIFPEAIFA